MSDQVVQPDEVREAVLKRYSEIATNFDSKEAAASCCSPAADDSSCCESSAEDAYFENIYQADTSSLPLEVTGLSLGCGDPITLANLRAGQTVLDLGSGGGIDCFLAADAVGETGYVIGVDMTDSMLEKANQNLAKVGKTNVEFRKGQIEKLPVADNQIDIIISNCVINLSTDKPAVFREAYRVLKAGGQLAVSDMVRLGDMTEEERADMMSWSGCIAGAEEVDFYAAELRRAGFKNISICDRDNPDLELASVVGLPLSKSRVFSARITATK